MKKMMLLLLCLLLVLPLYGCDGEDRPDNSIDPPGDIYIGMPQVDFYALYPDKNSNLNGDGSSFSFQYGYAFLEDAEGNPVVVHFEPSKTSIDWQVASVKAYDKDTIHVTEETFDQLERGMSVEEIVSILGCPVPRMGSTKVLEYIIGEDRYCIQLAGKAAFDDHEFAFWFYCIQHPDNSLSYPIL